MVFRRVLVSRTQFRKLPFGAKYWTITPVPLPPVVKMNRRSIAAGFDTNHVNETAVADTSVAVIRVPDVFLRPA